MLESPDRNTGANVMALRTTLLAAVCLAPSAAAASELIFLKGELTEGAFFAFGEAQPVIFDDFPVPYTATFSYQPEIAQAAFYFIPLAEGGEPEPQRIFENLFPGVQRSDAEALVVDHDPPVAGFMDLFDLTLDKTTGEGAWQWYNQCLICDRWFDPSAKATITEFREVEAGDFDEDGDVDDDDLG